jgi:hypothetical protein
VPHISRRFPVGRCGITPRSTRNPEPAAGLEAKLSSSVQASIETRKAQVANNKGVLQSPSGPI